MAEIEKKPVKITETILRDAHQEPWGQVTARLLSPEGLLVGISYMPDLHDGAQR